VSLQSRAIETGRLRLRRWESRDREPFARLNADPRVMEFFPALLAREESDTLVDRIEAHFRAHGFGLYAVELRLGREFIGFAGLSVPAFQARFTPCVEIGFDTLGLDSLVSFTVPGNVRSRGVMEKIGMTHDPDDDFDHPGLPEGDPLRSHVLYRLKRPAPDPSAGSSA
jgi:RimJ/RimL family protein N-acetyltransferase